MENEDYIVASATLEVDEAYEFLRRIESGEDPNNLLDVKVPHRKPDFAKVLILLWWKKNEGVK